MVIQPGKFLTNLEIGKKINYFMKKGFWTFDVIALSYRNQRGLSQSVKSLWVKVIADNSTQPSTVWKNDKFSLTEKNRYLETSLAQKLLSRNFCQKK